MFTFIKDFGLPAYMAGGLSLIAIIYSRAKWYQEFKQKISKEQLDAILELFKNDIHSSNPFVVEQVFNYKFKCYIPYRIIKELLKFDNPTSAIKDYIIGGCHIKLKSGERDLRFRGNMKNRKYRKFWKTLDIILYFTLAIAGGSLLFSLDWIGEQMGFRWLIASVPPMLYLFWMAYETLMSASRIAASERIMTEVECKCSHNQAN